MADIKLEVGMYDEARKKGLSLSEYIEWKAMSDSRGEGGQFDWFNPELKTSDGRRLDAFEQALMHFGIKVRGEQASTGDAFFYDPNARVLFPEFLVREFRFAEQEGANELTIDDIVASRVGITNGAYRAEYIDEGQSAELLEVAEGAELPTVVVKRHEQAISLYKYGAQLKMTYESLRRARLDHVATFVRKVALDTRRAKVRRAIDVLINGDGNSNPAPNANHTSPLTFDYLVDLVVDFTDGFEPSVLVADKSTVIRDILKLDVFTAKDSVATGANFRDSGNWPMPLGKKLRFVENTPVIAGKILGVDPRYAVEEVYEEGADNLVETERLITSQFNVIAFSEVVGYAKIFTGAARTITLT